MSKTFLTLDKPGGEYYKGGQSLLPTKSASSSSAFSHMILALRGERAELCPVNPIPLEVCYNISQCPPCKLPGWVITFQRFLCIWVSALCGSSRGLNPGPSSIAEDALATELLDWADAVAKIS